MWVCTCDLLLFIHSLFAGFVINFFLFKSCFRCLFRLKYYGHGSVCVCIGTWLEGGKDMSLLCDSVQGPPLLHFELIYGHCMSLKNYTHRK